MKALRSIFLIINYKTFIVTFLSLASTWICSYYNLQADFPLTLIGIAIVFPVVFSIDSAYKRREMALASLGDFKNHLMAIYQASRDWLDPANPQFTSDVKKKMNGVYAELRLLFLSKEYETIKKNEISLAKQLSELSVFLQDFRKYGLQVGEMSRISQYISKLGGALGNMKVVLKYRTPVTLRAYSKVFIYSFPILYGPYFVYVSEHYSHGLEYMMPIIFSFILVSLDNIQKHLENPFDQIGEDDIKFDVEEFNELMD
jgi:predicted membrane chloride channel (bestrophin family)